MAKITLDPILGSYASVTTLNSRLQQVEDALNDDVLWRNNPVGETNTMFNDLDMNGYSINNVGAFSATNYYLGAYAAPPSESAPGVPLTAADEGKLYFNTTDNTMYVWTGSAWSSLSSAATSAASVSITDVGAHYNSTNVEDALAELASNTIGEGASIVGISDAGGYFTGTDVEAALAELGIVKPQRTEETVDLTAYGSGTYDITTVPLWCKKMTIRYVNVGNAAGNFDFTLALGDSGGFAGHSVKNHSAFMATVGSSTWQTSNALGHILRRGFTTNMPFWGETVIHKYSTTAWCAQSSTGAAYSTHTQWHEAVSTVDLATGPLTQVRLSNTSNITTGTLHIVYEG